MRSSLSYGRRKSQSNRLLVLGLIAALTAAGFYIFGGPDGDPVTPPLGRTALEEPEESQDLPDGDSISQLPESKGEETPEILPPAPVPAEELDDLAEIRASIGRAEASGDLVRLRSLLGPAVLDVRFPSAVRRSWLKKVDKVNQKLVFSPRKCPGFRSVVLRRGDTYTHVARRFRQQYGIRVGTGMLEKINRRPAKRLRAGQSIKVPEEALSLVVIKSDYRLYVLLGKVPVAHYPVGLGRDDLTPEATFTVAGKAKNPVWTDPRSGKVFRYGQEGHMVGSRWLGFYQDGRRTGFGIHGTSEPESIGKSRSDGCIRLHNRNVEALFDLVPEGTIIHVRA